MNDDKLQILFTLGDKGRDDETWIDYLQYGFDESDVPGLLALVGDARLHQADIDSNEAWVPLHAWRALGQIGSSEAIEPLLKLFDEIVEDDWALSELPLVMSMIGPDAIEPLTRYLRQPGHDEFSRVMAADALKTIALNYPETQERIVRVLTTYLDAPCPDMVALNGLVVLFLIELEARESIATLRRLYASGAVDITCAGDLEDVEIALGLRRERQTPRPDYDALTPAEEPTERRIKRPDSDDVFELLGYYLERFGNDEAVLDVSELDGFFTALNCAPAAIDPNLWLDAIWGGPELAPAWPGKRAFEEFAHLAFVHYHHVQEKLADGGFEPIYLELERDGERHLIVDEWCAGFLRGATLWPPLADGEDQARLAEALEAIEPFATEEGWEALDALDAETLHQRQGAIRPAVLALFGHFEARRQAARTPVKREAPKVGRNDPCPCGSGKKYKKCCLAKV